ncbi:hypothetical protein G6F43_002278 [Rhizopus delemar]|nr:hypothetical protein G6F43_002278 [Rhizopus delemar]
MTDRSESPAQLMALIAKQFLSRIAVATIKEGSQKIAEINFDPSDPAIDHILKDGITFENHAFDFGYRTFPFLKKDILKKQLKMSLEPYGSVLDLGILRESHTGTCMGTGYAVLSVLKNDDRFSSLSHHLPWYQSEDEGKLLNQDEIQSSQASSSITMSSTSSQPLTSNIMKRKCSIRNESGDDLRIYSSIFLTAEKDPILLFTQEVLKALFSETVKLQDDIQIEINARNTYNPHVATDIVIVDQST